MDVGYWVKTMSEASEERLTKEEMLDAIQEEMGDILLNVFAEVTADRIVGAIRDGVREAMWQMITNATDAPCHDFYTMVKMGVEEAMEKVRDNG
jgi:hypothetical protein